MSKTITSEILLAYSQCPHKAFLLMCTKTSGVPHEYIEILEQQRQNNQRKYLDILQKKHPNVQLYSQNVLKDGNDFLINGTLEANGLVANCAILTKVKTPSAMGRYSYEPTIFVGTYSLRNEQTLELFFVGHVLEQTQNERSTSGRIIGLNEKSYKVKLEKSSKILIPLLEPLKEWAAETPPAPPPIILNKHCPTCQFRSLCRSKAKQEDSLSLLDGISTLKAINKYEKKGLFTIKQLSYTFKPRKRKRRARNPPPVTHKPELQALALREGKIYLQQLLELNRQPIELFLDIEGIPDQQFYYLIGLLVCENDTTIYHSFWADTHDDEAQMWQQFLDKIGQYPNAPIYHYGSFESRTMSKLAKRYEADTNSLGKRLINVNKHIFGKVYFPVYSNSLKEIGAFIGANWSSSNASGLQSLIWRHYWDETRKVGYQEQLVTYNREDCLALKLLVSELSKLKYSADTLSGIDFVDQHKKNATEASQQAQSQFKAILTFSYFDYDKKKINFRQGQQERGKRKTTPKLSKKRLKPSRIVQVAQGKICPNCKKISLRPNSKALKKLIIDLILTKSSIRKIVTQYEGFYDYCDKCARLFAPPTIRKFGRRQIYDHGFKAWFVYHRVALRLPYELIIASLDDHFGLPVSPATFSDFMEDFANYYAETEKNLIERLLETPFIHVDETTISIEGVNWYVWVFTDEKYVIFRLQETREATIVHELLANYKGILISDFYPGYDAVECKQQKCWVHLIGDLNNDLQESPFDTEYENFVFKVRNLIVPIMEAVQRYGLKKRHLNKFKQLVDKFYKDVITGRHYKSDLVLKYQKRFIRYQESLFIFLEQDGIPWHNNAAERALRHIAKQRAISTSFYEISTRNYLVLLGIYQTCRFQNKSFFRFLFSRETDLDKFEAQKQKIHGYKFE